MKRRRKPVPRPPLNLKVSPLLVEMYALLDRFVLDERRRGGSASSAAQILSEETGLGFEWVRKVQQRLIADPGVNRIDALVRYLREPKIHTSTRNKGYDKHCDLPPQAN